MSHLQFWCVSKGAKKEPKRSQKGAEKMSDNARTYHRDVSDSIEIETSLSGGGQELGS